MAAQTCDDQYANVEVLLEQAYSKYGTLYSGGPNNESVGPTLEIYRMLSGLPDSGMADSAQWDAPYIDPGGDFSPQFVGETLVRSLPRLHDPSFRVVTDYGRTDVEILLNRLTTLGPYAGWWLTPNAPHLTETEQVIAQYAVDDGLNWLLTVQVASARPHNTSWHLIRTNTPRDIQTVQENAAQQYLTSESLPWFVAAHVVQESGIGDLDMYIERLNALRRRVDDCSASSADYLAFSIATFERLRLRAFYADDLSDLQLVPPVLRRIAAVQLGKLELSVRWYYGDRPEPEALAELSGDPAYPAWHNYGRSVLANDLDALITLNAGTPLDPKTYRLLNLLSADDLLTFANARDEHQTEERELTTVAFLRLFALGRDDDAAALVTELERLWPDRADLISQHWDGTGERGIRLARVALALPEPRTLIVPPWDDWSDRGAFANTLQSDHGLEYWSHARRSRDLPIAIRTGGFLTRDVSVWMRTIGSSPYAMWMAARRTYRRGIIERDVMNDVRLPLPQLSGSYYFGLGIAGYAAWDELSRLGPETGLANRIGREIVLNARSETGTMISRVFGADEQIASELELVIRQGRRMIHGEVDGQPLGKIAFALLHRNFQNSDVAERTPYWFTCRERCEP